MKISIITPTYNSEDTILTNIESILRQDYNNWEQIIIDNFKKIKRIKVIFIYKKILIITKIIPNNTAKIAPSTNRSFHV